MKKWIILLLLAGIIGGGVFLSRDIPAPSQTVERVINNEAQPAQE